MEKILVCDIDNTVGDQIERLKRCIDASNGKVNIDLAYSPEIVKTDIPLNGAFEGVNAFKRMGFKIVWLSARKENLKEITQNWLLQNGFPLDELILVHKLADKIPIIKSIQPTLVIDDCTYNLQELDPKLATEFISKVNDLGVVLEVFDGDWSQVIAKYL
jgi:hypothetical protein